MTFRSCHIALRNLQFTPLIFSKQERFLAHLHDHFCNPDEPWDRVLSRALLRRACQKIAPNDVSLLQRLYDRVADAIAEGVAFSTALPLYAVVVEKVTRPKARSYCQRVVYCIAQPGFVIVCSGTVICSAYFASAQPGDAAFTLFNKAWKDIKCRCAKKQYVDSKYNTIYAVSYTHLTLPTIYSV